jgi:hypothetical protein
VDANGATLPGRSVTWTSDNTGVATVSQSGLVTAVTVGGAHIVAESEGHSGSAAITVAPPPPYRMTLSVALRQSAGLVPYIFYHETAQVVAKVYDAIGTQLMNVPLTWASDLPAAIAVSTSGVITGVGRGLAHITATAGGVTATLNVQAEDWAVMPTSVSVTVGGTADAQLLAVLSNTTMCFSAGLPSTPTWTVANTAVATATPIFVPAGSTSTAPRHATITGVAPGNTTLNVTCSAGIGLPAPNLTIPITVTP